MKNIVMITTALAVLELTGCDREEEQEEACPDGQVLVEGDTSDTGECVDDVAEE